MKWIATTVVCGALAAIWFLGAARSERYHLQRARDWVSEGVLMTNAIHTFWAEQNRCPTNLQELSPRYYSPSNQTELGWELILECSKFTSSSNAFALTLPFGDQLRGEFPTTKSTLSSEAAPSAAPSER